MAGSGLGDRGSLALPFCSPCVSPQEGLRGQVQPQTGLKSFFCTELQ